MNNSFDFHSKEFKKFRETKGAMIESEKYCFNEMNWQTILIQRDEDKFRFILYCDLGTNNRTSAAMYYIILFALLNNL